MSTFQSEHPVFVTTIIASATLEAGDPITAAGAKATNPTDFYGIAMSDAASGDATPVMRLGEAAVLVASGSAGVSVGDPILYDTDGYDDAGTAAGFATALSAGAAGAIIRIGLGFRPATA